MVMSFIPPNDYAVPAFINALRADGNAGGGPLVIDHHWYLNWAGDLMVGDDKSARNWTKVHQRACHAAVANWQWCAQGEWAVMLGEWSLATCQMWGTHPQTIVEATKTFLTDLQIDYLDCLLLHMPIANIKGFPTVPDFSVDLAAAWRAGRLRTAAGRSTRRQR